VLFAVEASKRWAGDGITANAPHPGGIWPRLQRYVTEADLDRLRRPSTEWTRWPARPASRLSQKTRYGLGILAIRLAAL